MFFSFTLLCGLLLASDILAFPSGFTGRAARRDNRRSRQGSLLNLVDTDPVSDTASDLYSTNWAGALWTEGSGTFTNITGTFTVPTPSGSNGDSAAVWVGIDGQSCTTGLLQTGIAFTVTSDGPEYEAWYEWYPNPWTDFTDITISAGDIIQLTIQVTSTTTGTATIENLTSGLMVSADLVAPSGSYLCGQDAEWIVEDYQVNSGQVPFADFGTVTFTDAVANPGSYTPSGANTIDIKINNQVVTSVSTSGSSVTIQYV